MRHGEIWEVAGGSKVLVASSDRYNSEPDERPLGAPIVRYRSRTRDQPWVVATGEPDPVAGSVVLDEIRTVDAGAERRRVGMMTGATMAAVADGLRAVFDLEEASQN